MHCLSYRNFKAPLREKLEEGIVVLDSGCGPAAWTFEMAKEFPNSKFYGVDITPNEFPEGDRPDNCEFQVANISEHIPYPDNTFDYIYQRLLIMGLTHDSWNNVCIIGSNGLTKVPCINILII